MRPCWELIHCQPDKKAGKGRIIQVLSVVVAESNSPRTLRNKNLTLQYWGLPFGWQSNFVKSILKTLSEEAPSQFATHGDRKGYTQAKWIKNDNLTSLWMPPRRMAEWSFIVWPILNFDIKCGWMIYSRPKHFYCGDGAPSPHLIDSWVIPTPGLETLEKRKIFCHCRNVLPAAHCTERVILALIHEE